MNEQDWTSGQQDDAAAEQDLTAGEVEPDEESPVEEPLPAFPPPGVQPPEGSTLDAAGEVRLADAGIQMIGPFWFCFSLNGRSWGEQAFHSPGPDEAALTAQQMAGIYQMLLRNMGYRAVVVGVSAGHCP